jgi:DNA-binding ferritin-like protein
MRGDWLALGAVGMLAASSMVRRGIGSLNVSGEPADRLTDVLAALRALHWSHWTTHWQVSGKSFYGDHLLFERLYSDPIVDEIDGTAERIVAYVGPSAVSAGNIMSRSQAFVDAWATESCPYRRALKAEKDTQASIKLAYEALKKSGQITLGLDDWLMGLASAHDTNVYLIQQRLRDPKAPRVEVEAQLACAGCGTQMTDETAFFLGRPEDHPDWYALVGDDVICERCHRDGPR